MLLLSRLRMFFLTAAWSSAGLPVAQADGLPATTTRLTISTASVVERKPVTVSAVIENVAGPLAQGQVAFCEVSHVATCSLAGANLLRLAQVTSTGVASFKLRLGAGNHQLVARFLGTTGNAASSSSIVTLTVKHPAGAVPTQITFTPVAAATGEENSPPVGFYGLETRVGTLPGNPAPTGKVTYQVTSPSKTRTVGTAALAPSSTPSPANFSNLMPSPTASGNGVLADFNEDGIPDFAVAGSTAAPVVWLPGVGDGSFPSPSSANAIPGLCPHSCSRLATADFNGDGHADLATVDVSGADNNPVYALRFAYGKGDGSFRAGPTIGVKSIGSPQLLVGDYNGDGLPDLLINGTLLAVVLQQVDHSFKVIYPQSFGAGGVTAPASIAVADVNGDGRADFVGLGPIDASTQQQSLLLFLSGGDGTFYAKAFHLPRYASYSAFVIGDFNGDGIADAVVAPLGVVDLDRQTATLLPGDGRGSFGAAIAIYFGYELDDLLAMDALDVNGDGKADLLFAAVTAEPDEFAPQPGYEYVLLSQDAGQFTSSEFTQS